MSRWGRTGAAGLAGLAGLAYAAPRLAAARLRSRPDDPDPVLEPIVSEVAAVPSHDGGTIHVVRRGAGPPVVLSHGVTLSVRTWTKQLQALPGYGFEAIAFDHRGHGRSVLGTTGHSVENLGEDVRSVLEGLDLRDAVLVGHSMGGVAVQSFAIRHPEVARERVRGLVLLSTLARTPVGSRSTRMKARYEQLTSRTPDTKRVWSSPTFGLLLARLGFGADPRPSHVELVRHMMLECPAETRRDAPRSLVGLDLVDALDRIDLPTVVVCGTRDLLTPPSFSRAIAARVPGARLELLAGGGHMLMLERPAELDRLIVELARSLEPTRVAP